MRAAACLACLALLAGAHASDSAGGDAAWAWAGLAAGAAVAAAASPAHLPPLVWPPAAQAWPWVGTWRTRCPPQAL